MPVSLGREHFRGNVRAPTIPAFSRIICQQIEATGNEVDKLKFCDRPQTHQRGAAGCAHNGSFRDWRIDYSLFAEMIDDALSNLKRAAIDTDILADEKHGWVAFHF